MLKPMDDAALDPGHIGDLLLRQPPALPLIAQGSPQIRRGIDRDRLGPLDGLH
jgi:hypothetical protein